MLKSRDHDKEAIQSFRKTLGGFLRTKRLNQGWGLESVAEELGVSTSFLCNMEKGDTNIPNYALRKLVQVYQIPQSEILNLLRRLEDAYWRQVLDLKRKSRSG